MLALVAVAALAVAIARLRVESTTGPSKSAPAAFEMVAATGEKPLPRVAEKPIGQPLRRAPAVTQESEEQALDRAVANAPTYTIDPPGSPKRGMALFPAPGTDPVLRGIVVPEDFPLPEGYVRHHQVTDDGQPLPPILMFHPDFDWVDPDGAPIAVPADRVVPPELAPEGMPIEILAPPAGAGGAGPSF